MASPSGRQIEVGSACVLDPHRDHSVCAVAYYDDGSADGRFTPTARTSRQAPAGLAGAGPHVPRSYGIYRSGFVEERLHDAPRFFHDVLASEAPRRPDDGVPDQPLVRLGSFTEGCGKIAAKIDALASRGTDRGFGLHRERDPVVLAETETNEVAAGGGAVGVLVEQHAVAAP